VKITRQTLGPSETDPELVFGVLLLPLTALSAALLTRLPPAWQPICFFHRTTGFPCGTCGAMRSFSLLVRLRIAEAWLCQPFLVTLAALGALYVLYSLVVVLGRRPRLRVVGMSVRAKWTVGVVSGMLFLANWLYLVAAGR
jgi:hypothetical protein